MATIAQLLKAPLCPKCGQPAKTHRTKYGVRHRCCGLHSWGGKPLVTPETHAARQAAHEAFDPIWKDGLMTRRAAYRALARALGLSRQECHISLMDEEMAKRAAQAAEQIKEHLP